VVRFDLTDPATWSATFAGAERMFLLGPPQLFRVGRDLLLALEAAAAGVGHVVFLSIQGRPQPAGAHRAVEDHRRASPMAWTILRASYLLQNRSTTHAPEGRERALFARRQGPHRLRGRPRRRRVAARVHTVRSHQGTACILTGWRSRRGPSARKRPAAGAVPRLACPRTGPEVAFKQGHSTLPPPRACPDN
jgi:uncharacterized protein YbjT (DUF2867 family)